MTATLLHENYFTCSCHKRIYLRAWTNATGLLHFSVMHRGHSVLTYPAYEDATDEDIAYNLLGKINVRLADKPEFEEKGCALPWTA